MDFDELYDEVQNRNKQFKYFDNMEIIHRRVEQEKTESKKTKAKHRKRELSIFQKGEDEDSWEQQQVRSPQFGVQTQEENVVNGQYDIIDGQQDGFVREQDLVDSQQDVVANMQVVRAVYENYQQLDPSIIGNRQILQNQQQLDQKSKLRKEKIKENHQRIKKIRDQQKLAEKIEREIKEQKQYDLEVRGIDHDKLQNRRVSSCSQSIVRKKNMVNMTQRLIQLKHVADDYYPKFLKRYYGIMAFKLLIQFKNRNIYLADRQYEKWLKKNLIHKIKQALYQSRIDRKILENQKEFKINQYRYSVLIPKCFNVWLGCYEKKQKKLDIYRKFNGMKWVRKVFKQLYDHCLQCKDLKRQNQKLKDVQSRRQSSKNKIKEIQQYNQNAKNKLKYI